VRAISAVRSGAVGGRVGRLQKSRRALPWRPFV